MAAFVCNRTRTERLPQSKFFSQILTFLRNIFHRDLVKIYVAAGWRPENFRRLSGVTNALAKRAPQVPKNKLQNPKNIDYKILDRYDITS